MRLSFCWDKQQDRCGDCRLTINARGSKIWAGEAAAVRVANNNYGTLVHTYSSGTREYERDETVPSANMNDDQRNWIGAMSNVVQSDIRDAIAADGANPSRIDIDLDNGRVTAWVNVSRQASPSGLAKAYYDIDYDFTVRTRIKADGTIKRDNVYKGLKLRLVGATAY